MCPNLHHYLLANTHSTPPTPIALQMTTLGFYNNLPLSFPTDLTQTSLSRPRHRSLSSQNGTIDAETRIEVFVIEPIQEAGGTPATPTTVAATTGVSTPESPYHHSSSIASTPLSAPASPSSVPITTRLPSSHTSP